MKGLRKLTYELPSIKILDTVTLEYQHTRPTNGEYYAHTHMCLFFFPFIYIYIYTHTHKYTYPKHTQMNPKDDTNNEYTHSQMLR